jgi:hypothetical protein
MEWLKGAFLIVLMFFDALPFIPKITLIILITMCAFFLTLSLTAHFFR